MSNFFKEASNDLDAMKEQYLGPPYSYSAQIKTPQEMGMSGDGSKIDTNIKGIRSYVQLLFSGGGDASKTEDALGPIYFLPTGAQCKDTKTGKQVRRSLYINSVPIEKSASLSAGFGGIGVTYEREQGLIPGILNDIEKMNPFSIFGAFMSGTNPDCMAVTLPTKNTENQIVDQTQYLTIDDIKNMSPCLFKDKINPITKKPGEHCIENFANICNSDISSKNPFEEIDFIKILKQHNIYNFPEFNNSNILEVSNIIAYIYIFSLILLIISLIKK